MNNLTDNELLKEAYQKASLKNEKNKIGLLMEHTLHRTMKFVISPDESFHEQKIDNMFVDVLIDNHIYEVQTKSFNVMRQKLDVFLAKYPTTICYPIAENKLVRLFNEDGTLKKESKSPRHLNVFYLMIEQYKIKKYLGNPNLSFRVYLMDMIEERVVDNKPKWHSKGFERLNQIPTNINRIYNFNSPMDYINVLKEYPLKEQFTSSDFAKATHTLKSKASTILNVLLELGAVKRIGKENKSYLYQLA